MLIINCLIIFFMILLFYQLFLATDKEGFKEGVTDSAPACCTTNEGNITYLKELTTDYPDVKARVTTLEKKVSDLSNTVNGLEQANNAKYNAQSSSVDIDKVKASTNPANSN